MRRLVFATALLVGAGGQAAEPDVERGVALAEQGKVAYQAGRYGESAKAFAAAYDADPRPAYLTSVAAAAEKAGELDAARDALTRFLEVAEDAPRAARARADLARVERALERRAPELALESDPVGASVFVDGAERAAGRTPLRLPLPPGRHRVVLRLDGHEDDGFEMDLREGRVHAVQRALTPKPLQAPRVVVVPKVSEPPPAGPPPASGPDTRLIGGLALVGAGVAATGVGVWLHVAALDRDDEAAACKASGCAGGVPEFDRLKDEASGLQAGAVVGYVAGGALAVAGVALLLWPEGDGETALRLGPGGAALQGRF